MSKFNDRIELATGLVQAIIIAAVAPLAILGAVSLVANHEYRRAVHNEAVCDETCAVMELRNMQQADACWCGDDDHSIRVSPFAWENSDGTRAGFVKPDFIEMSPEN
jgi:hypothetical protein